MNLDASRQEQVDYYLCQLDGKDADNAYHSLLEMGPPIIPAIIERFRHETEPEIRATLVEIVWQQRSHEALEFLYDVLDDDGKVVWKQALNGLVALGSPNAMRVLEDAFKRYAARQDATRMEYIKEAIGQITAHDGAIHEP